MASLINNPYPTIRTPKCPLIEKDSKPNRLYCIIFSRQSNKFFAIIFLKFFSVSGHGYVFYTLDYNPGLHWPFTIRLIFISMIINLISRISFWFSFIVFIYSLQMVHLLLKTIFLKYILYEFESFIIGAI